MGNIERWVIRVCPTCNRVKEAAMGCAGAHEAAHKYVRTERVEVVRATAAEGAVEAERVLLGLILKADRGDWDRTVPLLAKFAEARLRELGGR